MPVSRLERRLKEGVLDAEGEGVKNRAIEYFGFPIESVRVTEIMMIDAGLSKEQLKTVQELFTNPVFRESSFETFASKIDWDWAIWVGYRPGVMDPPGSTAQDAIEDRLGIMFKEDEACYSSKLFLIKGKLEVEDANKIADKMLANKLIQRTKVFKRSEWDDKKGIGLNVPKVILKHEPTVTTLSIKSNEELQKLSDERNLFLNPSDIPVIRRYFKKKRVQSKRKKLGLPKDPTDVELEFIAQRRSDHCNHNTFKGLFRYKSLGDDDLLPKKFTLDNPFKNCIKKPTLKIKKKKDWIVKVLDDNAGVRKLNDRWNITIKSETHNSPSAMEAYGGAITGIVGVHRDPMGTGIGSKIFAGTYGYCFGPRDYDGDLIPKLHPRRLADGVITGVKDGDNKSGVPTAFGNFIQDYSFLGKCLVYVSALGYMPAETNGKPTHEKSILPGDLCIVLGGGTGKDGIHGVTAASAEMSENIPAGHVQIGDPYTQRKVQELLLEARDMGLIRFTTDCGGGGLSSSVGESAEESGGVEVQLDQVPLKYAGLDPWEIWVSESQERMIFAIDPKDWDKIEKLAIKHDVKATVIGTYTDSGQVRLKYKDKYVCAVDLDFFEEDFPQWEFDAEWIPPELRGITEPVLSEPEDHNQILVDVLARPNVCSKQFIMRQYDHEVQGGSVVKPFMGVDRDVDQDACVIRPLLTEKEGYIISQVLFPQLSRIDAGKMAAYVADEAVRRVVAVGGDPDNIGGIDNYCWPTIIYDEDKNPDGKFKAAQLVRAIKAVDDYCYEMGIPFLSGKDSMYVDGFLPGKYGEVQKISGLETLQFTADSVMDDFRKAATLYVKKPGDLVFIIGETRNELGGSEYYEMFGHTGLNAPMADPEETMENCRAIFEAIQKDLLTSCKAVDRYGLGIDLVKMAFGGGLGMDIDLAKVPVAEEMRNDEILYSLSTGRFVVTIDPGNKRKFENILKKGEITFACIGEVAEDSRLSIKSATSDKKIIDCDVYYLKKVWKQPYEALG